MAKYADSLEILTGLGKPVGHLCQRLGRPDTDTDRNTGVAPDRAADTTAELSKIEPVKALQVEK